MLCVHVYVCVHQLVLRGACVRERDGDELN